MLKRLTPEFSLECGGGIAGQRVERGRTRTGNIGQRRLAEVMHWRFDVNVQCVITEEFLLQ